MSSEKISVSPPVLIQLLAGMALFGSATPLSKIISGAFPVFTASFARMVIAALVLAPVVLLNTARFSGARRSDIGVMIGIALTGMVGFTATMLFGMRLTTGVIGSTVMSTTPAVTALGAVLFLGDSMNWRKVLALMFAVTGCVLINVFRGTDSAGDAVVLGALLVAVAVCFEAAYTLLSRRLSEGISSLEATFGALIIAAPLFFALAFALDPHPFRVSDAGIRQWSALVFWSAAVGGLAPVLWYRGVRQAPGALTAASMSVMPLTALLLSYALLGEEFRWIHIAGFGLVFAGLVLMIFEHAGQEDSPDKERRD